MNLFHKSPCRLLNVFIVMSVASCTANPPSSTKDIGLISRDSNRAVIYQEGNVVKLRRCMPSTMRDNRECDSNMTENQLNFTDYRNRLAAAFGVDQEILLLGYPERLDEEISRTKSDISGGDLSLAEKIKAQDYLARLERNHDMGRRSLKIIAALVTGHDLILNEAYANDYGLATKPFEPLILQNGAIGAWPDPLTGLLWQHIEGICWYDAMGLGHASPCLDSSGSPYNRLTLSCAQRYGTSWRVATSAELDFVRARQPALLPSMSYEGVYFGPQTYLSDNQKHLNIGAACVSVAKVADPDGDVDHDGVLNKNDRCNRIPDITSLPVELSGPRSGCAKDQILDQGSDQNSRFKDGFAIYIEANLQRYTSTMSTSVACIKSDGNPGTKVYSGLFDPLWPNADGRLGAWVANPHSSWQDCH